MNVRETTENNAVTEIEIKTETEIDEETETNREEMTVETAIEIVDGIPVEIVGEMRETMIKEETETEIAIETETGTGAAVETEIEIGTDDLVIATENAVIMIVTIRTVNVVTVTTTADDTRREDDIATTETTRIAVRTVEIGVIVMIGRRSGDVDLVPMIGPDQETDRKIRTETETERETGIDMVTDIVKMKILADQSVSHHQQPPPQFPRTRVNRRMRSSLIVCSGRKTVRGPVLQQLHRHPRRRARSSRTTKEKGQSSRRRRDRWSTGIKSVSFWA